MGKGRNCITARKIKRNHPLIRISNNIKKQNNKNINIKHNLTLNEVSIIMYYINNKSNKLRNLKEDDLI